MDKREALEKIALLKKEIELRVREIEKIADEAGVSVALDAGGTRVEYFPNLKPVMKPDYMDEAEWTHSTQECFESANREWSSSWDGRWMNSSEKCY